MKETELTEPKKMFKVWNDQQNADLVFTIEDYCIYQDDYALFFVVR